MRNEIISVTLALAGSALAQTTTAPAPATSSAVIVGGQYNGQAIAGKHVGAAQNYQVVLEQRTGDSAVAGADQFIYNQTSNMLMDQSVVIGYSMPCYIISASAMSNNSGVLECGATASDSQRQTINLGDDGSVHFVGVQSWWTCSVNTLGPYGVIPSTIVGGYTTDMPTGPSMANCTAFQALKLVGGSPAPPNTTTTITTVTSTSSSASGSSSVPHSGSSSAVTSSSAAGPSTITSVVTASTSTPPPTGTSSQGASSTTSSSSRAASFTGAAAALANDMSSVAFAAIAGGIALLV